MKQGHTEQISPRDGREWAESRSWNVQLALISPRCRLKPLRGEVRHVSFAPPPNHPEKWSPISVTRPGNRHMSRRHKLKSSVCIYWSRALCTHAEPSTHSRTTKNTIISNYENYPPSPNSKIQILVMAAIQAQWRCKMLHKLRSEEERAPSASAGSYWLQGPCWRKRNPCRDRAGPHLPLFGPSLRSLTVPLPSSSTRLCLQPVLARCIHN